jgi:energy-converting hydrogenase Eha subunit A
VLPCLNKSKNFSGFGIAPNISNRLVVVVAEVVVAVAVVAVVVVAVAVVAVVVVAVVVVLVVLPSEAAAAKRFVSGRQWNSSSAFRAPIIADTPKGKRRFLSSSLHRLDHTVRGERGERGWSG